MAHFRLSKQNFIHYFKWTAVLTVVSNSFFTGAKNEKYSIIRNAGKFIHDNLDHMAIFIRMNSHLTAKRLINLQNRNELNVCYFFVISAFDEPGCTYQGDHKFK